MLRDSRRLLVIALFVAALGILVLTAVPILAILAIGALSARDAFGIMAFLEAITLSLLVATISATLASAVAYALHVALGGLRRGWLELVGVVLALPLLLPSIGVAISLSQLMARGGSAGNLGWVVLGHLWLQVPMVHFLVGRLRSPSSAELLRYVRSCPGHPVRRHVHGYLHVFGFPLLASAFIAFAFSLEEAVVAWFVGGFDETFAVRVQSELRSRISASLFGAGLVLFTIEAVLLAIVWTRQRQRALV